MPVQVKGYLLIAMATTLWGLAGAVAKYFFNQALSPFILVQIRLTVSAVLLVVFLYLRYPGLLRLDKADYKKWNTFTRNWAFPPGRTRGQPSRILPSSTILKWTRSGR
ncbi:hypothetical protein SY88_17740 [Clostridiales bacterium PH28_bin88]|nr:hypothetical protein SY88_17740 [Clostridiales bacterium PH28_bin88]